MNSVIHFEIPAEDMERAKEFYSKAFGWTFSGWDERYAFATTTESDENGMAKTPGAINGALMEKFPGCPGPLLTIGTDSIEDQLEKVKAAGGEAVGEIMEVPDMGRYSQAKDSEGNTISLWQSFCSNP